MRLLPRRRKLQRRETDYAPRVDVPLLIAAQSAMHLRRALQERVERRRPAPVQIVFSLLHQIPKAGCVAGIHTLNARPILGPYLEHWTGLRLCVMRASIAPSDMGHVDAQ